MALVLLTPIGLDADCWSAMQLPREDVVMHEFPGYGSRPRAPRPLDIAALADDLAERVAGELDLVGVSLGGMVAQHVALRHGPRVRSLLLACTGAAADPETMRERALAAERDGMHGVLEVTLERWFTSQALSERPEHPGIAYARRTLLALEAGAFADGWRAIAGHDTRSRLAQVEAPSTCLAGLADAASPLARLEGLAAGLPNSRLVTLDGPHMLHLERPVEFSTAVAEHLAWAGRL
jgi:pimeloyl-ACP methyl ester carboxylesterase